MTLEMAQLTLDGSILPSISGSTGDGCYVGIQFPTDYVGIVNEISFFLDEFSTNHIVDKLHIEASNDNFVDVDSIELLAIVSEEAHEGWNYYDLSDLAPQYAYYRLRSNHTGGCEDIGEIHYMGYEVINDDSDTYDCKVEHVDLTSDTKTDLGVTVTYDVAITPVIDDILPRWGAVSGGT